MVRYLVCFACAFATLVLLLRPTDASYAKRHAEAAWMLREAQAAEVQTVSGPRFYRLKNRHGSDGLYWRPRTSESHAQCINCPFWINEMAQSVASLDYVQLSDGRRIVMGLRNMDGSDILSRSQVITILEETEAFYRQQRIDPAARDRNMASAILLSLVGAIMATVAYLGMRLRNRNSAKED